MEMYAFSFLSSNYNEQVHMLKHSLNAVYPATQPYCKKFPSQAAYFTPCKILQNERITIVAKI